MPPKKRAAEEEGAGPTTRSAKAPKTEKAEAAPKTRRGSRGGKKGPKANIAASAFKARAQPIHINITHTAPDDDAASAQSADPGFIGTTTLSPSTFATGSYGWKGNKRFTVELENPEGGEGEKEKVHVMLTINATVIGSKGAKEGEEGAEGEEHAEEEHAEGEAKEAAEAEESLKETNGEGKGEAMEEVKDGE